MAWACSIDLRRRVVDAYLAGDGTYAEVAARFSVGEATVNRWLRRHRETGRIDPKPHRSGNRPKVDERGHELLRQLVQERPDATLTELASAYQARTSVKLAVCMVYRELTRLGITRKKRHSMPRSARPIA
jgi:transposase